LEAQHQFGDGFALADNPVERRLAAILAADVVGYSRMMGQDEAGTLSLIRALRTDLIEPKITEHKGRLFKTMGDGFLVEFPSVVNAVACAVAIQKAMVVRGADLLENQQLALRIGVNVGDVIVEGDDLFGDGVNVAARLEGIGRPGDVVISGAVRDHLGNRLDLHFDDLGEQRLKNIGIPIRAYAIEVESVPSSSGPMAPATTKPSIAVLPFDNMSGDPTQQYISDGITEDLTTELARFSGLTVASRLAAFHYGGKGKSPNVAARELGVTYVVEGSVRVSGPRLRIAAQLIDARTGKHIWADRYDRDTGDIFTIQDQVVAAIVAMLEGRMAASEAAAARAKSTTSWSAYDCLLQGRDLCDHQREPEAVPYFERAIEIDPRFALAHAWLAVALTINNVVLLDSGQMARADGASKRALELDAKEATSHWARALYCFWTGDHERSRFHFQRAMTLNPADIQIKADYANWQRASGRPADALATIDAAISLGPFVPDWFAAVRGQTLFDLERYEEAVEALESVPVLYSSGFLYLAAARAQMGDLAGASEVITKVKLVKPDLSLRNVKQVLHYALPEARERLIESLHRAGLAD
jgi:adenylate cyclase